MSFVFFSAIQFVVGSFLTFALGSLLVRMGIALLQIKNARVRSLSRALPLGLLTLDAILNQFRIGNWLNPLRCESCLHKFLVNLMPRHVQEQMQINHISFSGWLVPQIPELWLKTAFVLIVGITASILCVKVFQLYFSERALNQILSAAKPCERKIKNLSLSQQTQKCEIYVSDQIEIPMAIKNRIILIPSSIMGALSEREFDAVIAHEYEHLRWKDPYVKLINQTIAGIFWWIPLKSWLKQLEEDQEMAADAAMKRHNLTVEDLAGAILKLVRNTKRISFKEAAFCHLKNSSTLKRLRILLGGPKAEPKLIPCLVGTAFGVLIVVSCMI